jgi:hypothetical protein
MGSQTPLPPLTPTEFVALVANDDDWTKLQDVLLPFRSSPARDEAVADLLDLLANPDDEVRARSLSALAQIKRRGEVVVPAMIPLLDDPATNIQWHAADVLGEFGDESEAGIATLERKMMDNECEIATYAAVALKKVDSSVDIGPRLVELTKSPIRENRWRAVTHLPDHVSAEVAERCLTTVFAAEEDAEIRMLIADELNRLSSLSVRRSSSKDASSTQHICVGLSVVCEVPMKDTYWIAGEPN